MESTDYCDYKLSLALKACGFDEPCRAHYTNDYVNDDPEDVSREVKFHYDWTSPYNYNQIAGSISAPLLYNAQKWLREKKRIAINVIAHDTSDRYREGKYHWEEAYLPNFSREGHQWADWFIYGKHPLFDTYEEALSDGLSQMLELIKKGE